MPFRPLAALSSVIALLYFLTTIAVVNILRVAAHYWNSALFFFALCVGVFCGAKAAHEVYNVGKAFEVVQGSLNTLSNQMLNPSELRKPLVESPVVAYATSKLVPSDGQPAGPDTALDHLATAARCAGWAATGIRYGDYAARGAMGQDYLDADSRRVAEIVFAVIGFVVFLLQLPALGVKMYRALPAEGRLKWAVRSLNVFIVCVVVCHCLGIAGSVWPKISQTTWFTNVSHAFVLSALFAGIALARNSDDNIAHYPILGLVWSFPPTPTDNIQMQPPTQPAGPTANPANAVPVPPPNAGQV